MQARVFGGGSPATGEPAELTIDGATIQLRTDRGTERIAVDSVRVREIGVESPGLELSWHTADGIRAVQVLDPTQARELALHPSLASTPQFAALRSRSRRAIARRSIGWTIVALIVLLPLLLLLAFIWQADNIAAAVATRIPIEREVKLGDQVFAQMQDSLDLQDAGPAYEAVQTLGQRLTRESRYPYRFHVAKNDAVNAFAVPGGIIVVHTGLISATRRPEELAGVLAHEVQHIEQRHSLEALVKDLGLRGLWLIVTGDIGSGALGQAALELTSLRFSRNAEKEADHRGFDVLVANGIDPSGMAEFFSVMDKQAGPAPPPLLSTHPASADRERDLRQRLNELEPRTFPPLQMGPWPP